ncbi:13584_t:CDS:10 [Funneliformis geosporum]|uniref:13584_t:CDS:1 n=1 Tax=Funneliformis geosporum TaxID=1117311 RepID=A0A9W4WJ13_9GLOM|nr:13584_t:CDS:10 [Funneliformis geosporum]
MDYYELEVNPLFENHRFQFKKQCSLWRMNLLAVSDRNKNIMFVAKTDIIYVYRLGLLDYKPGVPIKELKCPIDESLKSRTINAIKVGNIGNEEVLVSVDDLGDVFVWFTANLDKNPIQFNNDVSTWGIALHGPKRLLAVSANSHSITIFNLQKSVQFFNDSGEEESHTPKTYASEISDDDALGGKAKSVLQGHENNIPNICFSACGRFLVSCSIDNTCRLWNVKNGELIQTKVLVRHGDEINDDWYEMNEDWGWTANFVSKSAFKTVSPNSEVCSHLTPNPESSQQVRVGRFRITEYEDGYMEDRSDVTGVESDDVEEDSNENDYTEGETDSDGEEQRVIELHDGDRASNNEEITMSSAYPILRSTNREPTLEVEGNSTPAYYDRAESTTPVVENYTENNPDYRWSVGHELNILSNHEQSDGNAESESKNDHDGERSEGIAEEDTLRSPIQGSLSTSAYSPVQPSYSPRSTTSSPQTATSAPSHLIPNLSSETSGNQNNVNFSPSYSPVSFMSTPLVSYQQNSPDLSPSSPTNPRYVPNSPSYSPVSPQFTPFSPNYVSTSPRYSPVSPHYSPTSSHSSQSSNYSPISPRYSPTSPHYSPTSSQHSPFFPHYSPISPQYSPTSIPTSPRYTMSSSQYSPISPHYSPTSPLQVPATPTYHSLPHDSSNYSPTSPHYSPTLFEHSSRVSTILTPYSPTFPQNLSSPRYSPVSPTYSPISSTEYNPVNRESSPSYSTIIASIINDLQRESPSPSPDNHEIESNSQSSHMNTVNICDPPSINIDNAQESPMNTTNVPTNEGATSSSDARSVPLYDDSPSKIAFDSMDISDVHDARRQLSDELVLYTSKHDLFILDPKSHLDVLRTENDVVCKVDTRRFLSYGDYDRLNMIEVIPDLSLTIVASQQGKVALTRLIKIIDDNGDESYYLYPEKYLPLVSTTSTSPMSGPLLGMFVAKHDTLQDPALFYYRLYLLYWSGTMLCYEIRRKQETNPLRMDNILI